MTDQIKYQAEVMQRARSEFRLFEQDLQSTLYSIRALPTSGVYFAINNGSRSQGSIILNKIDGIEQELVRLSSDSTHLADIGLSIMQAMETVEYKMSEFVKILGPVGTVVDTVFRGVFSRAASYQEIMHEMEDKFSTLVKDFEDVVAVILAARVTWQAVAGQSSAALVSVLNTDVSAELSSKLLQPISSLSQMNYSALVASNPDIERKGVKMGFSGEYWDPNTKMQCTLYAAARRTMIGRPLPANGPWGNAGNWADSARRSGLTVTHQPAVGDVFCVSGSYYGHVGVVEKVNADGSILISEGNYNYNGAYNTRTVSSAQWASWWFIK